MKKNIEKLVDRKNSIIFATKMMLIVYVMLISIPLLRNWFYFSQKLVCAWTLVLFLFLLWTDRGYYRTKEYLLMALFCGSYLITILLNIQRHFINELLILGYTVSLYFMMTYCDSKARPEEIRKELTYLMYAMVIVSFVFAVINLGIYFYSYPGTKHVSGGSFFYGISGGQLGGIYNPNTGGTINYISAVFTFLLLKKAGREKIFLILNLFVQFWCFSLVQSRGAWVSVLAFAVLYFLFVWKKPSLGRIKELGCKALLLVVCVAILTSSSKLLRNGTARVAEALHSESSSETGNDHVDIPIDRNPSNEGTSDFTTGRTGLWKIGLEEYRKAPVFGIGYRSIDDALKDKLSEYDYGNSARGGLHNIYLTVLVSSGVVGFVLFAALIVFLMLKVLKIYRSKQIPTSVKYLATCIPAWLIGDLVESRIALSLSLMSVLFWIMVGYVLYFSKESEKNDQCDCSNI